VGDFLEEQVAACPVKSPDVLERSRSKKSTAKAYLGSFGPIYSASYAQEGAPGLGGR